MKLFMGVVLIILSLFPMAAHSTVIPSDSDHVVSLDGTWRFKLEQPGETPEHGNMGRPPQPIITPKNSEPFETLEYKEDNSWRDIHVPGNWEMAGFSPATYNNPDNAIGLYRLSFDIPASWRGRVVKINFDGVQNGAEVFLNGQLVEVTESSWGRKNYHEGGWTAFQADLTPAAKFGEKNLLAIRVTKNTKSVDLDTGDYFFLGGVHRPVTLFSVPQAHVNDLTIRTPLLENGAAEVRVRLSIAGNAGASMQFEGSPPVEHVPATGQIELLQTIEKPRLWSAEHPSLYRLLIDLKDENGQVIEHIEKRIGIREVSIKGGKLLVNNVPVKLAGICRHDVYATLGTAINEEVWRKDLELMKASNINAVRTSHYPYGSKFYDLCDEIGLYVADEMAACWTPTDSDELTPAFQQHARELVQRDKNHPSVIIWAVGNENRDGNNNGIAADEIRKLDDTRPRLVSCKRADQYHTEFDDEHYTPPNKIAAAERDTERRKTIPMIYLEDPNVWEARNGADYGLFDRWAAVIDRTMREIWKNEHVAGTFLWEWQDRAVADQCTHKLYDYFPDTGIQLVKVKGLVDAWRNPRPSLYQVKMAYAPISFEPDVSVSGDTVTLHATNRYSFTDLSELKTTWVLLNKSKEAASGNATLSLAPLTRGDVQVKVDAGALQNADALQLAFEDAGGRNVVTYQFRLKPEGDTAPKIDPTNLAGVNFPRLNLVEFKNERNNIDWRSTNRRPMKLVNISIQSAGKASASGKVDDARLYATPLADVRAIDADVAFEDAPGKPIGHVHVDCASGKFSYRVNWTGDKADILELGWRFAMPREADHFSWHRKGYWSYYPPTHIGRISGTATPDSANVPLTKMERPDAYDFISTKYDCDWASLADSAGRGIGVRFAPEHRQHCRASILSGDAGYELVVNLQCSPPRDISSNVVPDYYLTLQKNAHVEASFTVGKLAAR